MAELTLSAADIAAALKQNLEGFTPSLEARTVGRVSEVGDGIARVSGLPDAAVNELLEFEDGTVGLALNLDETSIGAVVLGDVDNIEEGQTVKATGRILSVPVGDGVLGRVVNALGEPIDGQASSSASQPRRMEIQAPGITGRKPVHEPLQTGIKSIDAMTPIGRGQRELIIGDRKTGKTTIAIDTILNQRGQGVKCIYVAIGQKGSTVAQTVETLRQHGAMDYTVVVTAPAADPAPFKYLAPYAGCAMGQHWMENGEHALVVYDDLSKQAEAYRQVSLLLRRPPGREAYPGRRLLPAQPPARAGRQAVRRERRRLADGAADHRDQGRRHLGVHPDERDLDHRRPGLRAGQPVQVRCAPGRRRRQLGVARRWRRPDQVDEAPSPARSSSTSPSSASSRRSPRSAPSSTPCRRPSSSAATGSSSCSSSRSTRPMPVEEQVVVIFAGTRGYLDDVAGRRRQALRVRAARVRPLRPRRAARGDPAAPGVPDGLGDVVEAFKEQFRPPATRPLRRRPDERRRRRGRRGRVRTRRWRRSERSPRHCCKRPRSVASRREPRPSCVSGRLRGVGRTQRARQ